MAELLAEDLEVYSVAQQANEELTIVQKHLDRYEQLVLIKSQEFEDKKYQKVKKYLEKVKFFI
ncbi:MAG: hypothetical protein ACFFB3_19855 [Candidatus Hodarchaeota archaeon]